MPETITLEILSRSRPGLRHTVKVTANPWGLTSSCTCEHRAYGAKGSPDGLCHHERDGLGQVATAMGLVDPTPTPAQERRHAEAELVERARALAKLYGTSTADVLRDQGQEALAVRVEQEAAEVARLYAEREERLGAERAERAHRARAKSALRSLRRAQADERAGHELRPIQNADLANADTIEAEADELGIDDASLATFGAA